MDMANNHSLTVDKNSPQVSESSAPVVKVLAANIHMLLSEDIGSLIVTEDIPRSKATEETVKQAGMCSEEDENQHHGTIQTFYKLLEIYYKLFGGRMESDENITQFSTWQQNIIPKMKDILKYYCSKISKCKTDSTEDEMSDVQQKSTGQCHDMLENVEKIFEDEFNSEEMENYVGTQDQITLSDFNEMLEKCCDQMYGDTCENEFEISKKGASERQKGNAALKNIEATTRNTGSIENQKNNDVKKAASLRKKHKDSRVNNKPSRKQLETSEKMDSKQEMATSIKQIYGSSRRKAGANKEEPEGDMCNAYKPESNISPSVKTASVQPKARTRPKTEPDRSTSNGGYPRTIRRNTNLEVRWRLLSPYLDKSELKSSLAERPCIHYEYKSRLTANKIVEPHISYKMDHMIPDLLTEQLNNWNKRDKIHTKKPANQSAGSKITDSRIVKLKKTPHYFDEENNSDYLATRRTFYDLQLDLLKFENQFQQSAMESVLNEYLGHSKGSHAAIKELTDYYCH